MTSRERVRRAIEGKPVDRYPIDLGMHFSTGISVFGYYNLRKYLGLSTDSVHLVDTVQMLAAVDDDVRDMFHIDTTLLYPIAREEKRWRPREGYEFLVPRNFCAELQPNGDHIRTSANPSDNRRMRMPQGGFFADGDWLQICDDYGDDFVRVLARQAEALTKDSERFYCLMSVFTGFFTGIDMACDMLTDPDLVHGYNRKLLEEQKRIVDLFARSGGEYADAIEINSDLGMQNMPMLSPDSYWWRSSSNHQKGICVGLGNHSLLTMSHWHCNAWRV